MTFSPGETTKTLPVLVNGDTVSEPDESFFINLTTPINATLAVNQGLGTILNDDGNVAAAGRAKANIRNTPVIPQVAMQDSSGGQDSLRNLSHRSSLVGTDYDRIANLARAIPRSNPMSAIRLALYNFGGHNRHDHPLDHFVQLLPDSAVLPLTFIPRNAGFI